MVVSVVQEGKEYDCMSTVYTVSDLTKILKIGKNTAYALMRSKGFPSYKINERYYVTESALNEWLTNASGKNFNI